MESIIKNGHTKKILETIDQIQSGFRLLSEMGCKGFDCSKQSMDIVSRWGRIRADHPESLAEIRKDLGDCHRCRLSQHRRNIVFGTGNPRASLVFIGEGPGYDEDIQGEPFVGAAGQLLTKIIQAIQRTRERVYISNIVKCRPPNNRNPKTDEIQTCYPFLHRQIQAIHPKFICALGTIAAQSLLQTEQPISALRGKFHNYRGIKVLPTYHPAYLLRNPEKKRAVWEDMKELMTAMGIDFG